MGVGVGAGAGAGNPPPPYPPPAGTAVVNVDQATAPAGALTDGAVPQPLNVVVNARVVPPAEIVEA